jgi:hypothetical protein
MACTSLRGHRHAPNRGSRSTGCGRNRRSARSGRPRKPGGFRRTCPGRAQLVPAQAVPDLLDRVQLGRIVSCPTGSVQLAANQWDQQATENEVLGRQRQQADVPRYGLALAALVPAGPVADNDGDGSARGTVPQATSWLQRRTQPPSVRRPMPLNDAALARGQPSSAKRPPDPGAVAQAGRQRAKVAARIPCSGGLKRAAHRYPRHANRRPMQGGNQRIRRQGIPAGAGWKPTRADITTASANHPFR